MADNNCSFYKGKGVIMVEEDTIKLLRECNAGVKMGVASINDCYSGVKSVDLRRTLDSSRVEHEKIGNLTRDMLNDYHDEGKEPNPIAKGMSWMKTNVMLAVEPTDASVADLITDGCNMGVKSLARYLNQYAAAEEKAKDIAKKLIACEDTLAKDVRGYL